MNDAQHTDAVRQRFAQTAPRIAELEQSRREELRARLRGLLDLRGDERVLDSGAGTGALAFALAPLVREVIAVDVVPELLAEGRRRTTDLPNVSFVEGDAARLDFGPGSFDIAGTLRTLHHVPRPELVVSELVRVTRLGGQVLIVDQIAPVDPLAAAELDGFERVRDASHTRLLPDGDIRFLLDTNGLVVRHAEFSEEQRELEGYLDLAGCSGEERDRARSLAPPRLTVTIGWYVAVRPMPGG